jgi:MoaD family protein
MIKLRLFSSLREIAGSKEVAIETEAASISDLLSEFAHRYGDKASQILFDNQDKVWPSVLLLVNGEAAEDGPATKVKSGDVVSVLLPTAGG